MATDTTNLVVIDRRWLEWMLIAFHKLGMEVAIKELKELEAQTP